MKEKNNIKLLAFTCLLAIGFISCKQEVSKEWSFSEEIKIEGINPLGIAIQNGNIWISDSDHNKVIQIDENGTVVKQIDGLQRPMHLDANNHSLFIPEYTSDLVKVIKDGKTTNLEIKDSLDAPAGISVFKTEKAIADFYHHRIVYYNGKSWISFGQEGKENGDFYYPTDVQITNDQIWVADAYNNRVQVFGKSGIFSKVIGVAEKMNATTGIYVSNTQLFVTDFENNRVLIYDLQGNLFQELNKHIYKPTDMVVHNNALWILNYRKQSISKYVPK